MRDDKPTSAGRILVVSPCRDEEEHLPTMIRSMAAQTLLPAKWIVVDDGSTDQTPRILDEAASELSFMEALHREDRGERKVGPGVIEAFNAGLSLENLHDYEFVCKLDGDLELPPRYFELLVAEMRKDEALGTYSGKIYLREPGGTEKHERRGDEASVGPTKFYRVACFQDIGGFDSIVGWDGIDGHKCRLNNWVARSEDRPEIRVVHRRQMGSSDTNVLKGRIRAGEGRYFIGSSLPYILAATAYRLPDRPRVVGALYTLFGYVRSMARGAERYGDDAYRSALRAYEWQVLFKGKQRALARRNEEIRAHRDAKKVDA
jgi:glycosyltransferase involved in cell wall biosynthesis